MRFVPIGVLYANRRILLTLGKWVYRFTLGTYLQEMAAYHGGTQLQVC